MTYSRSRRRKRNNTETTQDDASLAETSTDISASLKDIAPGDSDIVSTQEEELTEEETRKLEIWETFREEYFEAVEQLPLSLHRSFALMKELDEHSQSFQLNLLPLIHKYVEQRRAFIPRTEHQVQDEPLDVSMNDSVVKLEDMEAGGSESGAINGQVYEPTKDAMEVSDSSSIPSVPSFQIMPQNAQSTQEILSRIAWLTSELVRTSDEKVNLAQAAYNSVDRHVRLLDHAIIEQESCMTLGMQPGTKPSSIVEAEGMVTNDYSVAHQTVDMDISNLKSARARKSSRTRGQENRLPKLNERKSEPPISITLNLLTPKERNVSPTGAKLSTSKRSALSQDMPIDPHEPRYCYCNQVSYGEMIACDNEDCEREWFHLVCCGFTEAPKGKWFCKDCHEKGVVNTTRKKGH